VFTCGSYCEMQSVAHLATSRSVTRSSEDSGVPEAQALLKAHQDLPEGSPWISGSEKDASETAVGLGDTALHAHQAGSG